MKIIMRRDSEEQEDIFLKEEDYFLMLKQDLSYEKEDVMWIELLAFKELLYALKVALDQQQNCVIEYRKTEKKDELLMHLLMRYPQAKLIS